MATPIDLSIGIVTYNGRALLAQCLESILREPWRYTVEIVVVDNASADDTVAWLAATYPQTTLVANERNLGIAVGNNQCLQAARGRYVLLLNNDTLVLPGTLDRLVDFADAHPDAGAVGGKLLNADGTFQSSYFDFPTMRSEVLHATHAWVLFDPTYPSHPDEGSEPREVDWICSASLLVRKTAAAQIGFVDEAFYMYSDETDLQYRLRQAGWKIYYLPDVATIHFGGLSASHWRRRKLIYRGKLLFFQKHYGPGKTVALRTLFAATSALKMAPWAVAWLAPARRVRARNELASNLDVVRLSLRSNL